MSETPAPTLGYTILYVEDVAAQLDFYERAFDIARRFFHDEGGKAYGELETGAARLAFASLSLAVDHLGQTPILPNPSAPPLAFEVALVTVDVTALYDRACAAGATSVSPPETKPWGQTVAYVRDPLGYLVELCTQVS